MSRKQVETYRGRMRPDQARSLAERMLAVDLPRRWTHVRAVAAKAEAVAGRLALPADVLVSAAWLHDIGYAADVGSTGFHPLDGARYLRELRVDGRIVELVAHHSCAVVEAEERGLQEILRAEFELKASLLADALLYCDMTTGPDGQDMSVGDRLLEIRSRYGDDHPVARFIAAADDTIRAVVARTEAQLADAP